MNVNLLFLNDNWDEYEKSIKETGRRKKEGSWQNVLNWIDFFEISRVSWQTLLFACVSDKSQNLQFRVNVSSENVKNIQANFH